MADSEEKIFDSEEEKMFQQFKAEYDHEFKYEEEDGVDLLNILRLIYKYKREIKHGYSEAIWDKVVEYIFDNLPAQLKNRSDESTSSRGEEALFEMFERELENEGSDVSETSSMCYDDLCEIFAEYDLWMGDGVNKGTGFLRW